MNFRSLFAKKPSLPYWAQGVTQQDYDNLLNAVRTYFSEHGTGLTVNETEGYVEPQSGPLEGQQLGLHNLVRIIPAMKLREAQEFINSHFGKFLDMQIEQERIKNSTFDQIKHLLRIRIYYTEPSEPDPQMSHVPGIQLCATLRACPVFDLEHSAMTVPAEEFEAWKVSINDAFRIGLEQTLAELNRQGNFPSLDLSDGRAVVLNSEEYIYFASLVLDLPRIHFPEPRCGYLIWIISRQTLIIQPLDSPDSLSKVLKLQQAAFTMFQESVGKVSYMPYWVRNGTFKDIEMSHDGGGTSNRDELDRCLNCNE